MSDLLYFPSLFLLLPFFSFLAAATGVAAVFVVVVIVSGVLVLATIVWFVSLKDAHRHITMCLRVCSVRPLPLVPPFV